MPDKTDFYKRLNIGTGASEEVIRKAYRLAVRKAHPDVNKNEGATQLFLDIQEAYNVLSDPTRKESYDSGRDPRESIPNILTQVEYSQASLLKVDEPQVIYALVDIVATEEERDTSNLPLNISLVVDNSTSMAGARLDFLKAATKEVIEDLEEDDQFSLVSFNDYAKVLLPNQPQPDARIVDYSLNNLFAEGGTEIFQGLEAGHAEITKMMTRNYVNQKAAEDDIGISGVGIGIEWNDSLIDQLSALTGGQSKFIQDPKQVKVFLKESISYLRQAHSRKVALDLLPAPGVQIISAFRILPEALPLPIQESYALGILKKNEPHRVLFEFLINPIPKKIEQAVIAAGEFTLKKSGRDVNIPFTLERNLAPPEEELEPPIPEMVRAISHLTFYRLQEKAQQDIAMGNPGTAYQRLMNLSSHLMAKGEEGLAKIAMNEAQYIRSHNNFSPTGKKQLKYGTIHLMLPEKT